jgi:hypothetical protein
VDRYSDPFACARSSAATVDHELLMAREPTAMVESGVTKRVVLAGIRHGEHILVAALRSPLEHGVRINPLRAANGGQTSLVVVAIT